MNTGKRISCVGVIVKVLAAVYINLLMIVSAAGTFPVYSQDINCSYQTNPAFETRILELINIERAKVGAPALSSQSQLATAARLHSADMACNDFFSHTGSDGASLSTRTLRQGYNSYNLGENIAAGYSTPESVMAGWMDSSGHKANILNTNYTEIGIGYVFGSDSTYDAYWTTDFGKSNTYMISGNAGIAHATITYTGGYTIADGNGNYSFTVSENWFGDVTPSKTGFTFEPAKRSYSDVTSNLAAQNYTASIVPITTPPGTFNKIDPPNGAINQSTSLTLSWGTGDNTTSYEYCYDTTNDDTCSNWTGNGTSTSRMLNGLGAGTTYYWHVRAVNSIGETYSDDTDIAFWSFTTAPQYEIPTPVPPRPRPVMKSQALTPVSLTTDFGMISGSLPSLGLIEQTGAEDDPAAYVSFQTPNTPYLGYTSFTLPADARADLISSMLLQVNFKGSVSSTQTWTWSIYDRQTGMWIKLGDSIGANTDQWQTLLFRIRVPQRYILRGGEIRIQLKSNNSDGDAKMDYEGIHITYLSIPAVPTPVVPTIPPKRPGIFSVPVTIPTP